MGPVKGSVLALTLVMLAFSVAFSISGQQNDVKVDPEVLEQIAEKGEADVIIVLKDDYSGIKGFSASSAGKDSLKSKKEMIRRQQDRVLGGLNEEKPQDNRDFRIESFTEYDIKLKSKFGLVNGLSGKITASGLEKLLDDGSVKEIYPTREIRASLSDSINIVNASMTWNLIYNNSNITGKGEVICIIDTGVDYTHASMGGCTSTSNINDGSCRKVIGGYDFVNSDQNPIDDHGHGTHVAGIVASTHSTYTGIARDANIIAIKVLDSDGSGLDDDLVNGINWCVNNASIFNISVISMSLGTSQLFSNFCDSDNTALTSAIANAIESRISMIAASGNNGNVSKISSPACIQNVTAVGSTTKADAISSFTNRNHITDLLAPGSSICSLQAQGTALGASCATGIVIASGTSMATPTAAGAFALVRQFARIQNRTNLTPSQIEDALNDTGIIISDSGSTKSNASLERINIFDAIKFLDVAAPTISINSPANATATNNISFIVNISASEILNNARLEANSTNFTMQGSLTAWAVNVSSLVNGSYTYRIYANDTFGNLRITGYYTILIDTIPPYSGSIVANNSNPASGKAVNFNSTWNDTTKGC